MRAPLVLVAAIALSCNCRPPPQGAPDEVYVAGGSFVMGHDALAELDGCRTVPNDPCNDFAPRHKVALDPYFIDKREVSIGDYQGCVDAGSCELPQLPPPGDPVHD